MEPQLNMCPNQSITDTTFPIDEATDQLTTTSMDSDALGPPNESTTTTTTSSTPTPPVSVDEVHSTTTSLIGGFIAFAVILCTCWLIWLYVANKRRRSTQIPYHIHSSTVQSNSKMPITIPKLMLQKSFTGHTEIVGLNRTTSVFSVTVWRCNQGHNSNIFIYRSHY